MARLRRSLYITIYGAKRRLPSIFGVSCSSFDIPAEGGSFFKRSLEKSVGYRPLKQTYYQSFD